MRIIIEGKQGEGKTRMARLIAAIVEFQNKTFRIKEEDGPGLTNMIVNYVEPEVTIITIQVMA